MTGRHEGRTPPLGITRRDWKPAFTAVVVPSLVYSALTFWVLATAVGFPGGDWWLHLQQLATVFGRAVIEQLGWVFGILITVQLGCLVALLGGQIIAPDRREEASLRSALSVFSLMPIVGLAPAITVAAVAAFRVAELRGALFVIVPALVLTIALSVYIGTLEVADELTKLEFAEQAEGRALSEIIALHGVPKRSAWRTALLFSLVLIVTVLAGMGILLALTGRTDMESWVYWAAAMFIVTVIPATVVVAIAVNTSLKPTLTADGIATSVLLLAAVFAGQVTAVGTLFTLAWQLGACALIAFLYLALELSRVLLEARAVRAGRTPEGYWRHGGFLAQAGTSLARRSARKGFESALERTAACRQQVKRRVEKTPGKKGRRHRDVVMSGRSEPR